MKLRQRIAISLFLLLGFPWPTQSAPLDQLVDAFVEIVDKPEFKVERRGTLAGITKWASPIEFAVVGASSPDLIREVEVQMERLRLLSNLQIRQNSAFVLEENGRRRLVKGYHQLSDTFEFATMREDVDRRGVTTSIVVDRIAGQPTAWMGNFLIVFGKRQLLDRMFDSLLFNHETRAAFANGQSYCFTALTIPEGSMATILATILIPTEFDPIVTRRCIVEETTQALGLVGDIPGSTITLFDDRPERRRTELTEYDEMFLRVLYNPEIKLGMTGADLRTTARRLIEAELRKTR